MKKLVENTKLIGILLMAGFVATLSGRGMVEIWYDKINSTLVGIMVLITMLSVAFACMFAFALVVDYIDGLIVRIKIRRRLKKLTKIMEKLEEVITPL